MEFAVLPRILLHLRNFWKANYGQGWGWAAGGRAGRALVRRGVGCHGWREGDPWTSHCGPSASPLAIGTHGQCLPVPGPRLKLSEQLVN